MQAVIACWKTLDFFERKLHFHPLKKYDRSEKEPHTDCYQLIGSLHPKTAVVAAGAEHLRSNEKHVGCIYPDSCLQCAFICLMQSEGHMTGCVWQYDQPSACSPSRPCPFD